MSLGITTEGNRVIGLELDFDKSIPTTIVLQYTRELERKLSPTSSFTGGRRCVFSFSMKVSEFTAFIDEWLSELDSKLVSNDVALEGILNQIGLEESDKRRSVKVPKPDKKTLEALFDFLVTNQEMKDSSGPLFRNGHYALAILEAFKLVNIVVKEISGLSDKDGKDLMFKASNPDQGPLRLSPGSSVSERDEQEGFMHIYAGAMQGIRNPKAHDVIIQEDPIRTLQYLSLASLLTTRAKEARRKDGLV